MKNSKTKVLILQRVVPAYRVGLFSKLCRSNEYDVNLVIGTDNEGIKAKNATDLSALRLHMLKTKCINLFGRKLYYQIGLLRKLVELNPDVLICEAESHFIGYVTAIFFKYIFKRNTKLILWCFYKLPGVNQERSLFHYWVKKFFHSMFDVYLSYTTYGKKSLIAKGISEERVVVAVNVCDTEKFRAINNGLSNSTQECKTKFGYKDKIVVSYIGNLQKEKRPELVVEIARLLTDTNYQFLIIGDGPMRNKVQKLIENYRLNNCVLVGRVDNCIEYYYRASSLMIIPGRGGVVISESMSMGVPVMVYQADGVELDLIKHDVNGFLVRGPEALDFEFELRRIAPVLKDQSFPKNCTNTVDNLFNTNRMVESITKAIDISMKRNSLNV